ncbi:MAG TPA: ABC transporter substrate-binding protein [Stellaceae bacterium]|nr:ABC transporter substrate-binding protein [Stellaceae bacterium]
MTMLTRRKFTKLTAAATIAAPYLARAADMPTLRVAEPLHSIGYLPLYAAIANGYFEEQGLHVTMLLTESGSAHTNAVLAGDAFGFIGGPEHNAFAFLKGGQLRSVVNIVNRLNVYMVAAPGVKFDPKDVAGSLRGKTIATGGAFGGTPNATVRYLCLTAGLKLQDVHLLETSQAGSLAAVKAGQAQFSVTNEPVLTQGIEAGIWSRPVWSGPQAFGDYAFSAINVPKANIDKNPEQVRKLVKGVIKGLQYTLARPPELDTLVKKEFPTMPADQAKATLDRYFADHTWSTDGKITEQAWENDQNVVFTAGVLKERVDYKNVVDPQFTT